MYLSNLALIGSNKQSISGRTKYKSLDLRMCQLTVNKTNLFNVTWPVPRVNCLKMTS